MGHAITFPNVRKQMECRETMGTPTPGKWGLEQVLGKRTCVRAWMASSFFRLSPRLSAAICSPNDLSCSSKTWIRRCTAPQPAYSAVLGAQPTLPGSWGLLHHLRGFRNCWAEGLQVTIFFFEV
jgi:hypothetical protein